MRRRGTSSAGVPAKSKVKVSRAQVAFLEVDVGESGRLGAAVARGDEVRRDVEVALPMEVFRAFSVLRAWWDYPGSRSATTNRVASSPE